jgi:hypothetical protein
MLPFTPAPNPSNPVSELVGEWWLVECLWDGLTTATGTLGARRRPLTRRSKGGSM